MPRNGRRRAHILNRNTTLEMPQECIWFDTETDEVQISPKEREDVLRFGVACFRSRTNAERRRKRAVARGELKATDELTEEKRWSEPVWFRFESGEEFWDWVESRVRARHSVTIFCHNANFDTRTTHMHEELPKRGWKTGFAVLDSPPIIITFTKGDRTIRVVDTHNFWHTTVDALGKTIGVAKLPMPSRDASADEWEIYCRRDVEVIMRACIEWFGFIRSEDLGSFAATLAGQSMHAFRHRFMHHEIFIEAWKDPLKIARNAYYGGRTECFFIGKVPGPVTALDFNSMYPSVMRDEKMPYRYVSHRMQGSIEMLITLLQHFAVCSHVELDTWEPAYPMRWQRKIIFPVGRFDTWLTTPELQYAIERGHIRAVHETVWHHHDVLFKEYAEYCWEQRKIAKQAGDSVRDHFFKIMINSFYGKFGQSGKKWKDIGIDIGPSQNLAPEVDVQTAELTRYRRYANQKQELMKDEESFNSFPAIAAHVTAFARMRLWKTIVRAGVENCYYCDTDSVYVNQRGRSRLADRIDDHELGALKVEKTGQELEIFGLKDYNFDGERKTKGVPKKSREIAPGVFETEQWSTIAGAMQRGEMGNPRRRTVIKHMERNYTKGIVTENGWVRPLVWGLSIEQQQAVMDTLFGRLGEIEKSVADEMRRAFRKVS